VLKYTSLSSIGRRRLNAVVEVKTIAMVCVAVLVAVVVGYWIFSDSAEDLLDAESLSPKQIRRVATRLLLHEDLKIRERASKKLFSLGESAVPVLKDISLTHSEQKTRLAVLGILARLDTDATIEVLEHMIDDSETEVRMVAAKTAAKLDDPRTIPVLTKALEDANTGIRNVAIGACETKRIKSAVPALLRALDDPMAGIRRHAARALRNLTGKDYRDRIKRQQK